jgi:tripartite-type tricarboxylate transporter receptor subunit TctC
LNGEIVKALSAPDVRSKLDSEGLLVVASTPDQFAVELKSGIEVFGRAVKTAGIKME